MQESSVDSGINPNEQKVIFNLLSREKPETTAEIGCANGASTSVIAQALEHNGVGHHHAVDPFQESLWKNAGKEKLSAENLSHRVTFHTEFPEIAMPTLPALDFVFIDGSHLFDLTVLDFVVSDKKLKVGGIMAFHDTWMPAVRSVLRFILLNRDYQPHRVALSRRQPNRWRRFKARMRLRVAQFICSDFIHQRPFDSLGLDHANLVFIRKNGEDTRDWRFFNEF